MINDLEDIIKSQNSDIEINYDEELLLELLNHLIVWSDEIYKEKMGKNFLKHKQIFNILRQKITREIQKYLHPHKIQIKKTYMVNII